MLSLYAETVVEVNPATAASRIDLQIPRKNGSYDRSKYSQKPPRGDRLAKDDREFQEQYLATASSLYFRQEKHYPRSFLWRVIAGRLLEIQVVDLSRPEKEHKEAYLVLSLEFQDPILPLGVSFADANNADELHVFVATNKNELYNLRLSGGFFRSAASIPSSVTDWCKPVDVSSLSIDTIYQVHASNPYEIFVAFAGGRIQRVHRKSDREDWDQDYYDDASWGSTIRGIVSRRGLQQIEYGGGRLSLTTAQGMIASPDTTYLYTLCLNHTLRVWQLSSGKLVETRDLLDVAREPNERLQLNPAEPGLIRLFIQPKKPHPTLVTYTPHEGGQFKFWTVKGGLTGSLEVEDRYPHIKLCPPDPDPTGNTVWSMTGFEIVPGKKDAPSQIWVLWRNNNHHQVYTMHFEDLQVLAESWENNWTMLESQQGRPQAPDMVLSDSEDVTTKWLRFMFYPGRYSTSIIETALSRYQEVTGTQLSSSSRNKTLSERLCMSIASSTSLRKYDNGEMDYDRFSLDTDHQWRNFWRLVENLNDGRQAPLSLAFDSSASIAWIAMTDEVAAVRECSKIELLVANEPKILMASDELLAARWPHRKVIDDGVLFRNVARLLQAAHKFRSSFSPELACEFQSAIEGEMFSEPEDPASERIVLIFNQIDFAEGLSEGAEQGLLRDLESLQEVGGLSDELVTAVTALLSAYNTKRHKISLRTTLFGSRLLSAGLLKDVESARGIILDLLTLIIFIDPTDGFDPANLFETLIAALKEQERNFWVLTHFRRAPLQISGVPAARSESDERHNRTEDSRMVSVMDDIFMRNVRPQPADTRPLMYLVTDMIAELQRWACGRDAVTYDDATVHIQCYLLVHGELDLATDFFRFQPRTPWSCYVKGRLYLMKGMSVEAVQYFQEAADALSRGKAIGDIKDMSAGLLSLIDAEHFNSGLPRYYQHVMSLFETAKAFVETAEFGRLALQALTPEQKPPVPNFESEVLSRLFTSELKLARFDAAFESLAQFTDLALQRSSATALLNAILDPSVALTSGSGAVEILQKLPWSGHAHLATHLDQHLSTLAKKQASIPINGQWTAGSAVDYLSILYTLRLSENDYRGATAVLFDRLRLVQQSGRARSDAQATQLRHVLLALINVMTCVAPDEAYILADIGNDPRKPGQKRGRANQDHAEHVRQRKRVIITLDDLRREYQQVLDKCSRIERGDFDFGVEESEDDDDAEPDKLGLQGNVNAMEL